MGIGRFFNKVKNGANKFFGKHGEGANILGKVTSGLGSVAKMAGNIASNPLIAATLGPEVNVLAGGIGAVAGAGHDLTNIKNYRGNSNQVSQNILERAQNVQDMAKNHPAFV